MLKAFGQVQVMLNAITVTVSIENLVNHTYI